MNSFSLFSLCLLVAITTMSLGTLYIHPQSPRSTCLVSVIKALGLDIKVQSFEEVENFKELFPLGKTPAYYENDGYKLTEFVALIEYFILISNDETYKVKNIKDKAQVLRWLSYINQDMVGVWDKYFFASPTDEEKKANSDAQRSQFAYLENELSTRSYFAGDYITIADVYLFSWYELFSAVVGGEISTDFPVLTKWYESVKENDAIAKEIANK